MLEPRQYDWDGLAEWSKVPEIEPTVTALLAHCNANFPARELIVDDDSRLTYGELNARSLVLARQLVEAGVGKGTRVGMVFPNGPKFMIAWFAIARIGAIAVPISSLSTGPELAKICRHADLQILVLADRYIHHDYPAKLADALAGLASAKPPYRLAAAPHLREVWVWGDKVPGWARAVDLSREPGVDAGLVAAMDSEVHSSDPVSIIYTSGSTADPKGVIHTHGNFMRQGARLAATYPYRSDDRIFTQMPFFWVGGLTLTILNVMNVGATMIVSAKAGAALLDFLEAEGMTYMVGWPHLARALEADPSFPKRDWSKLRGGGMTAALPPEKVPKNQFFGNTLGMTESSGPHHVAHLDFPDELRGSFGTPMRGTERRIVDPDSGRVLGENEPGELQVRGIAVMVGMVKRERADVFDPDGWYRTGDLCSVRSGHLFFHGRIDDMIKSSGANVSPREVEAVLMAIPGVAQANVSGVADAARGSVVGAIIVPRPGVTLDAETIRREAAKTLSVYKVPRVIRFVDITQLPTMSSSKVDRRALIRMLHDAAKG